MSNTTGLTAYTAIKQLYARHGYLRKIPRDYHNLKYETQLKYLRIETLCNKYNINITCYMYCYA